METIKLKSKSDMEAFNELSDELENGSLIKFGRIMAWLHPSTYTKGSMILHEHSAKSLHQDKEIVSIE